MDIKLEFEKLSANELSNDSLPEYILNRIKELKETKNKLLKNNPYGSKTIITSINSKLTELENIVVKFGICEKEIK